MISSQGGGTLSNSMIRLLVTISLPLFFFVSTACSGELSTERIDCIQNTLHSEIVRVDNKNQRLFVVNKNLTPEIFGSQLKSIKLCLNNSEWTDDWAISVFTEKKYAGYKDERNIIPLHKDNEWAKGYKLEYLNSRERIIITPAINPKEIKP